MTRSITGIAASALFALAAGAFLPAHAATDADLAAAVQSAITTSMGDDAKNITVTANGSDVTVRGWTKGPMAESKARYVASTVPGVTNAYSAVRTYSSESSR